MVGPIAMRQFVRARAIFLLVAGLSVSMVQARVTRGEGSSTSTASNGETNDARFRRLKAEGDRALAEKRLNDAIKAYGAALDVRRDPLIAGRIGLAISFFDDPRAFEAAASFLYEAVLDAAGVSSDEKNAFFAAYVRMRRLVCKLNVSTNEANARVNLGDGPKSQLPSFFHFVKKGKGEGVASLEGRADVHQSWDCKGDHDIDIRFDFPPEVTTPAKTITVIEKGEKTVKTVHVPIPVADPFAKPISNGNRLSVLFGPSVVFGVAQSPAYGLSIWGAYKFGNWSAMLGARGAYAFGPIERNPLDVFTFTGLAGPCFRENWFVACGFASMNIVKSIPTVPTTDKFHIEPQVTPGIGIGIGGRYSYGKRFGFYLNTDATILAHDVELVMPRPNGFAPVWKENQFLLSISLGVELKR
jgi:hypothetical protein